MTLNLGARRWIAPSLAAQGNGQQANADSAPKTEKNHADEEEREREIIRRIRQKIAEQTPEGATREEQEALAREIAWQETAELPKARREAIVREIVQSVGGGLGPLQPFVDDPAVTEIMVNAPDQVYVERNGEMVLTNVRFRSDEDVQGLVERIVGEIGRRFDLSNPMVDARLRDGSRVNAIRPPLALRGTAVTIRKFPRAFTFDDLVAMGSIPTGPNEEFDVAAALRWAVPNRLNIVVS
ncbi:MAG TPA: ATPase, T2SS/T4P/T4SS family, partial [Thermaerobacter sp.]